MPRIFSQICLWTRQGSARHTPRGGWDPRTAMTVLGQYFVAVLVG